MSLAGADTEEALQLGAEMHRNRTTNPFRIQPADCSNITQYTRNSLIHMFFEIPHCMLQHYTTYNYTVCIYPEWILIVHAHMQHVPQPHNIM